MAWICQKCGHGNLDEHNNCLNCKTPKNIQYSFGLDLLHYGGRAENVVVSRSPPRSDLNKINSSFSSNSLNLELSQSLSSIVSLLKKSFEKIR